jgi:hypothetical protein
MGEVMNDLFEIVEDLQYAAQSKNTCIPSELLVKWQERLLRAEAELERQFDMFQEETS